MVAIDFLSHIFCIAELRHLNVLWLYCIHIVIIINIIIINIIILLYYYIIILLYYYIIILLYYYILIFLYYYIIILLYSYIIILLYYYIIILLCYYVIYIIYYYLYDAYYYYYSYYYSTFFVFALWWLNLIAIKYTFATFALITSYYPHSPGLCWRILPRGIRELPLYNTQQAGMRMLTEQLSEKMVAAGLGVSKFR